VIGGRGFRWQNGVSGVVRRGKLVVPAQLTWEMMLPLQLAPQTAMVTGGVVEEGGG
jgi:hypothetical protein